MSSTIEITIRARPTRIAHPAHHYRQSVLDIITVCIIVMGESVRDGSDSKHRQFMSLGMFIIDEFSYLDEDGQPTGRTLPEQVSIHANYLHSRTLTKLLHR